MKKKIAYVCVLFACGHYAAAQTIVADTARQMEEVTVISNRLEHFNTGSKVEQVDSLIMIAYKHQSLADLLGTQGQLFIKTNGPGSIASSSFRGAGAEHTAILWNGFNLQSTMNGQSDLSLLQADVADEIRVQYGSSGALFGSGAVGGSIHLGNRPKFGSGLHASVNAQTGSFSNNKQGLSISYGSKRYYTTVRGFNQYVKNDFLYHNTFTQGSPEVKQTNASYDQQGIANDHYFMISARQQVNVHIWYQQALRQIPPPMSVPQYKATQQDKTLRISSEWTYHAQAATYFIRSGWFDERIVFEDSISHLFSDNHAQSNITEAEARINLSRNQFLNIGINNTYMSARADTNYGGTVHQERVALFASYKIYSPGKTLQACLNARQEMVAGTLVPFTPSLGIAWIVNSHAKLFGNVSRSYRVPTLNEQYWLPRAPVTLMPESGWGEELSLELNAQVSIVKAEFTFTAFNRLMDDWILWQPEGAYWTPRNIKQVWSRGGEGLARVTVAAGKWRFVYTGRMNYVLSTNEALVNTQDAALHKQLIYVPRLSYMNQVSAFYRTFFFTFNQTYTGIRFTQTDESDWINYYLLGNLSVGKEFSFGNTAVALNVQCNNVWDETYQVIKDRPMPGRNFLFGLTFKI